MTKDKFKAIVAACASPWIFMVAYLILLFGDVLYKNFARFLKDVKRDFLEEHYWFVETLKTFPEQLKKVWKGDEE